MSNIDPSQVGLPKDAMHRLRELEGEGGRPFFTSDLSVNEFLLVKEAGFEPKGLVLGSSIYHIGAQGSSWSQNQELTKLTQAMYTARELAMSRMDAEAEVLGADGVVGVRLNVNFYEWGNDAAEFIAIGTAIKSNGNQNWRTKEGKPFSSDLSGQDFWTLTHSGYMPLGLVMGTCVYHIGRQGFMKSLSRIGQNAELENFTQGMYEARELAMERMQEEARKLDAEGIVGVQLIEKSHMWGSHVIEFLAIGTAIRPTSSTHEIPSPHMVLSLDS
jgi:uncharacterized protein YbjQ (UPF0145 family)